MAERHRALQVRRLLRLLAYIRLQAPDSLITSQAQTIVAVVRALN